ncbi:PREDICTED: protein STRICTOSIDINE SYNTHASE-LIKE 3 [Camelina sativa]|uniref:Protein STRICTOSIDINE SYNTHASE-LIKE 3 n=1 Tax=Camelina sativa TaxID=90675 RepID=A0ABM0XPE6_CAMSA|nr:PREDICTED: protein STRICTOSIDINE SYNTHASE-LIKE 3 [Camelina sativa]
MNMAMTRVAKIFLGLAIYCAIDPFNHSSISKFPDFETYKIDMPPLSSLPKERDRLNLLQNSQIRFLNEVQGPESIAFDPLGRGPYTGVADGRILFWNGSLWTDFAYTSINRSKELCDPKPSLLDYLKDEHICGRPLGLRFDKKTGDLYIADAYLGIMKVGPEGGLATSLTTEADGVPLRFTNDLDIDDEGNVYFTDSSSVFQRRKFMLLIVSGEDTGRVLKYNPKTKETTTLVRNLQFPNGLSLGKDGSFFIFCEGSIGRLRKYWLKGEKAGTSEVVALLHGFPDNIRTNKDGDFWVAVHGHRNIFTHVMAHHPRVRKFFLKLPISVKFQYLLQVGGWPHGVVVKYSEEGKVLKVLEDSQGKVVKAVSEVEEKDGKLWMGSVLMSFIAVYDLP